MSGQRLALAPLIAALAAVGCTRVIEGPQLTRLPAGAVVVDWRGEERPIVPGAKRTKVFTYRVLSPPHDDVAVEEYAGALGRDDAARARERRIAEMPSHLRGRNGSPDRYRVGPLEELTIDGRPAWGWVERNLAVSRDVDRAGVYAAVVAYETRSYGIVFSCGDELRPPDELRSFVSSFCVVERGPSAVVATGVTLAILAGIVLFVRRLGRRDG